MPYHTFFNLLELWFVVEWANEGAYSEVRSNWLVGGDNPSIGDRVKVKEGKKKIYEGSVLYKGITMKQLYIF